MSNFFKDGEIECSDLAWFRGVIIIRTNPRDRCIRANVLKTNKADVQYDKLATELS